MTKLDIWIFSYLKMNQHNLQHMDGPIIIHIWNCFDAYALEYGDVARVLILLYEVKVLYCVISSHGFMEGLPM